MRILFMGTPDFAVQSLQALFSAGYDVTAVVTQPDKPKGRGHKLAHPPVYEAAQVHACKIYQPDKLKREFFEPILETENPDLIVVAAYGKILPRYVLEYPKYGCINVHASLLPKYRGAAPIQRSIIDGETETGVTIMQMEQGLDTGDMLDKAIVPIEANDTYGSLHDKLAAAGAPLLLSVIRSIEDGAIHPQPQDDAHSSYASMITKDTATIDWEKTANEIRNLIRGLNPAPRAFTTINGKGLKISGAEIGSASSDGLPGEILSTDGKAITVQCGCNTTLLLTEVQLEGKKRMQVSEFLKGNPVTAGTILKGR